MEETVTRHSTVFPPGYGDFTLEASDGLICHFPRYLLAYMSETFRDMFSLPAGQAHSNESQTPLKVAEPGQILELFLQNIDPKQPTPPIDQSTIVPLLEVAEKYQVSTITKWFEKAATLKVLEPFTATNPVLTLYCAVHFNLPNIGRLALQEFASCHISRTRPTIPYFDIPSYLEGTRLRETRREYIDQLIRVLADPAGISGYFNGRAVCMECTKSLVKWVVEVEGAIRKEPNWAAFIAAYERGPGQCHTCRLRWPDHFRKDISKWEGKMRTTESVLPAWPF